MADDGRAGQELGEVERLPAHIAADRPREKLIHAPTGTWIVARRAGSCTSGEHRAPLCESSRIHAVVDCEPT